MSRNGAKQERILDAAASLFGERAPETVTMEEVAASAGVAKGTLYTYFSSKDELVRELLRSRLEPLVEMIEKEAAADGDAAVRLRRAVVRALRRQVSTPDWFRVRRRAQTIGAIGDVLREREERLRTALGRLLEETAAGRDGGRDADLVLGAIDAAVRRTLESDAPDVEQAARELWCFLRRALGGPALAGLRVLVTREECDDGPLSRALAARGADVVRRSLLETLPPQDPAPLAHEARHLDRYDWIFLTSARAARALAAVAPHNGAGVHVAAVGAGTARAARDEGGWEPEVVGSGGGAALAASIAEGGSLDGAQVLFPSAEHPREEGIRALRDAGADVHIVAAYRTVPRAGAAEELAPVLGDVDAVTLTSPSAVRALDAAVQGNWPSVRVAAIGSSTACALEELGQNDVVVPEVPDLEALAEALARSFA